MDSIAGEQVKVTMELPSGEVYDLSGYVRSLELSMMSAASAFEQFSGAFPSKGRQCIPPVEFSLEISGYGPMTVSTHEAKVRETKLARIAREWKCPYCGSINPISARKCGDEDKASGCGASRPFIYE